MPTPLRSRARVMDPSPYTAVPLLTETSSSHSSRLIYIYPTISISGTSLPPHHIHHHPRFQTGYQAPSGSRNGSGSYRYSCFSFAGCCNRDCLLRELLQQAKIRGPVHRETGAPSGSEAARQAASGQEVSLQSSLPFCC